MDNILFQKEFLLQFYYTIAKFIIIFVPLTFVIGFVAFIFISKTSLFKKWTKKNKEKASLSLNVLNSLGLRRIKKGAFTYFEGVYKGKEIRISRIEQESMMHETGIIISSPFYNPKSFVKLKFIPIPSNPYFYLRKKGARGIKWSNFENMFRITSRINLTLSKEIKSKTEHLFHKGYFDHMMNTRMYIWPSYCSNRPSYKKEGKVSFILPIGITEDLDSLKIAMDIAVEIAEEMDKVIENSDADKLKPNIIREYMNAFKRIDINLEL